MIPPSLPPTPNTPAFALEILEPRIALAVPGIDLAQLDGANGLVINGGTTGDQLGASVRGAGDVNGDGFGDFLVGAPKSAANGAGNGAAYLVFGHADGFPAELAVGDLDGSNGVVLKGAASPTDFGSSVSAAGDLDNDGFDDLVIGAPEAAGGGSQRGAIYVVFGRAGAFGATLDVTALNGVDGFAIFGENDGDRAGHSVSGAGDVNDDGFDDLIIGAPGATPNGAGSGAAYLFFGASFAVSPAPGFTFSLASLDGTDGLQLNGVAADDEAGFSVNFAGDVNGDSFDDVIIGAPTEDGPGSAFVVFGRNSFVVSGTPGFALELAALDGLTGLRIDGINDGDRTGRSVSGGGDLNGDGLDEIVLGAHEAGAGLAFVLNGESSFVTNSTPGFTIALDDFNRIEGDPRTPAAGRSVSSVGDVNGDGFDDLLIGAPEHDDEAATGTGAAYVVFGGATVGSESIQLGKLDGRAGFVLRGVGKFDATGYAVGAAGDVNGDGFADLLIGAPVHAGLKAGAGAAYVVFGQVGLSTAPGTVTVVEPDGDVVTVKVAGGALTPQDITRDVNGNIDKIDLTRFAAMAQAGGKAINLNLGVKIPPGGLGDGKALIGQLDATGVKLGKVKLKGDLGQLFAGTGAGVLKLLKVTGDLGEPGQTTEVKAAINGLMVGGDLTGEVIADDFKKVVVGGNIGNGTLQAAGGIGSLKVAAKIINSTMKLGTKIGSLLVLGDVENSTVRVKDAMTKLDVRGDVIDSEITVLGKLGVTSAAKAVALKSVKVGGDFVRSKLLAGYDANGAAMNADVSLGPVTINGNFEASSIVAGATAGANGFFGDEDDVLISGGGSVVAKIALITIKGTVLGSAALGDHFGLVAEEIGKLKIGGTSQTLTPGPGNDTTPLVLGGTVDVKVREVTPV